MAEVGSIQGAAAAAAVTRQRLQSYANASTGCTDLPYRALVIPQNDSHTLYSREAGGQKDILARQSWRL